MRADAEFLADLVARQWSPDAGHGFQSVGLFLGNGAHAVEVVVARFGSAPPRTTLLATWKHRRAGRAAPVLLVVLHPEGAALCGASGEEPPVYPRADAGQVERLCREVLDQPDRHSALRFLAQALPSLETALPGLNNEGLLAMHELEHGAPDRQDWSEARRKAAVAVGKRDESLLGALGFQVERLDNLTSLLRGGDRRIALAVMLHETESPEAGTERFNSLSPVSYALAKADSESLSWVVLVQGNRLRLYSTDVDAGVGRRGRTETFIECQPSLLSDQHLPFLALTVLFRLLFIAYHGSSHWQETALFWDPVANGNREWSVPAYDGGLFTSDAQVSPAGAGLAAIIMRICSASCRPSHWTGTRAVTWKTTLTSSSSIRSRYLALAATTQCGSAP